MQERERPIRWTGEVADGDGMDFNAQLALKEAEKLRKLKADKKKQNQISPSMSSVIIDRLTGRPIGQEE